MFNVGEDVLVKGRIVGIEDAVIYTNFVVEFYPGYTTSVGESCITDKTYAQGLEDAWELARKLYCEHTDSERREILGIAQYETVLECMTAEEALAKIEAYERERIKVGDVVYYGDGEYESTKSIVTKVQGSLIYTVYPDGSCGQEHNPSELKKTGKHIEIEGLLRQIGE